jgi:tripartite-type tricarboxylate transporter receptor subunit TctC
MGKLFALALAMTPTGAASVGAQTYPVRPITIVVPFLPGGPTDAVVRILGERMPASLGQPLVVEYVSGAVGSLGVGRVARATPDGYTALIGHSSTNMIVPALYLVPFDVMKHLAPVAQLPNNPFLLVGRTVVPVKDLKEPVTWIKANPDKVSAATPGANTFPHIAGLCFQKLTGTQFPLVPYRGAAPALQDVLAGRVIPCRSSGTAGSKPSRSRHPTACRRCRTSRPWTKPACRASTSRSGTGCGCWPARSRISSPSSMPRWWMHRPTRPGASA